MNRDDIRAVLNYLLSAYPKTMFRDKNQTVDIWLDTFKGYEKNTVMNAAKMYIQNHGSFPNPYSIKQIVSKLTAEHRVSEAEKIAHANDRLPDFEHSGCKEIPCPYLREGQTDFCPTCLIDGRTYR